MDDRDTRPQPDAGRKDGARKHQLLAGIMIRGKGQPEASRVGLIWGALIVAAGVALLLDHMGFIAIGSLFRFWPMTLIFFGVGHLFTRSNQAWGAILIVVGAIFQLNNLGITHLRFADMWPVAIIAIGLVLMWGAMKPPIVITSNSAGGSDNLSPDMFNATAIFGGIERRIKSQAFRGGRATCIFGGAELDLRDANIDGDEATIEVNCIFGGAEIRVPDSWNVHSLSTPVLGGYSDKTHISASPDQTGAKRKTLIVTGTVIFGGVEIVN
jgi:predicted membrane protein